MKRLLTFLGLLVLVGLGNVAFAADFKAVTIKENRRGSEDARVLGLLANTSEDMRGQVGTVIVDQQRRLGACETLNRLDADEIWVMDEVDFFDSGRPARGRWQVRYTVDLCGETVQRNVEFTATQSGVGVQALVPGTSLADPKLAADVWRSFQFSIMKAEPSCRVPLLKRTALVEAPKGPHDIWRELWVAKVCDREMAQMVSFYPSKAGTLFRMALPKQGAAVSSTVAR